MNALYMRLKKKYLARNLTYIYYYIESNFIIFEINLE